MDGFAWGMLAMLGALVVLMMTGAFIRRRRWRRGHGRWFLQGLFWRLKTRPEQEKAIIEATRELQAESDRLRSEWRQSRDDLASVFAGGAIEDAGLSPAFQRQEQLVRDLQARVAAALRKVHGVLDSSQREQVATLLRQGMHHGCARHGHAMV